MPQRPSGSSPSVPSQGRDTDVPHKNISSEEFEKSEVNKIAEQLKSDLDKNLPDDQAGPKFSVDDLGTPQRTASPAKPTKPAKQAAPEVPKPKVVKQNQDSADDTIFIDQEGTLHLRDDQK
jgi:hypothetical protein